MKPICCFLLILMSFGAKSQDSAYVGHYNFPKGSFVEKVEIKNTDQGLLITSVMGNAQIFPLTVDTFDIPEYKGTIMFKRNNKNEVTGITILVNGMLLIGSKEPWASTAYIAKPQFFGIKKELLFS